MSTHLPAYQAVSLPRSTRVAVAAARFNADLVDALLTGCLARLAEMGIDQVTIERVPGAYELPLAAQMLARTGRYSAIIALGAVIRGDTPHFDYVAGECAAGLARVSLDESLPVIFGVLTTNTARQAWDRAGGKHSHAGRNAAEAAAEMIALARRTRPRKKSGR